jgi:hypothetical protein
VSLLDRPAPVVLRVSGPRRLGYGVVAGVVFGVLPLVAGVALAVSGGVGLVVAVLLWVLGMLALASAASNILQQWTVTDETLEWRRPGRASRTWPCDDLGAISVATPIYVRGFRVGTHRSLHLSHADEVDRLGIGVLGKDGLTRLIAAIRMGQRRRAHVSDRRDLRRDEYFEVNHAAIDGYRRRRRVWRVVGAAVSVSALAACDGRQGQVVGVLVAIGVTVGAYVIGSIVLQPLRRPAGPVPSAVRVTSDVIQISHRGGTAPEQHPWSNLSEVQVSENLAGEGILRLTNRTGETSAFSLTGRIGEDRLHEAFPTLVQLSFVLHDIGDARGIPVVDLQP